MSTNMMRQQNLCRMNKVKLLTDDLQNKVNIFQNQFDRNDEIENDVNQDQPKVFENIVQLL